MALIKCAECSREVSDKAAFCPYCGTPIANVYEKQQEHICSLRSGAIMGFIGYAGLALSIGLITVLCMFGQPSEPKHQSLAQMIDNIGKEQERQQIIQDVTPFLIIFAAVLLIGLACFIICFVRAGKLSRTHSIVLSSVCLTISALSLILIFAWWNFGILCMGWLLGWQPVLMTAGAAKMLKVSRKMPKGQY